MSAAGIIAAFALTRGLFTLDVAFEAAPGAVTALFGAAGCGKTTIFDCIAGLDRPQRGHIAIGDRVVLDLSRRIRLAPRRRRIGYVFPEGRLFPHLAVRDNLLYGRRRARGEAKPPGVGTIVELLALAPLLRRRPHELSKGDRQRVALGRAILSGADVLLLDEPLASLDAAEKDQMLRSIEAVRDRLGITMLYGCRDLREAMRIADTMVLLEGGHVADSGPVAALSQCEEHHARFAGADGGTVIEGRVSGKDMVHELVELKLAGGTIRVPGFATSVGSPVRLRVHPLDVAIALERPRGLSMSNAVPGRVRAIQASAPAEVDVAIACGDATIWSRVTRRTVHELALAPGLPVYALLRTVAVDRSGR